MKFDNRDFNRTQGIHCTGNGRIIAYGKGADITQLFGPPYSSPSFIKLLSSFSPEVEIRSEREAGTAVWKHQIIKDGGLAGEITDFADSESPCVVRNIKLTQACSFTLCCDEAISSVNNTGSFKEFGLQYGLLAYGESGIKFYNQYPSPFRVNFQILFKGDVCVNEGAGQNTWEIRCTPGESTIYFIGGPSYPECILNAENVLGIPYELLLNRTKVWWSRYTDRRYDFTKIIPEETPNRDLLLDTIDTAAVAIKVQQGVEGGVVAGYPFHLGYVRDQYGVSRCLLKLGYIDEAKQILDFYWRIWQRHGRICTAQAIGVDGFFHIHENDGVEITGYLIIQAFDYFEKTGDEKYLTDIFPMLEWAWNTQTKYLVDHMLPFNGDETYIAGGILPRSAIFDGSMEATLLFITGGGKLLDWACRKSLWTGGLLKENTEILKETRAHFHENFWNDGLLATNQPQRASTGELPRFRHGACEICSFNMTWMERDENGSYVCPDCLNGNKTLKPERKRYYLNSAGLMPLYIGSDILSKRELEGFVTKVIQVYKETGKISSGNDRNRCTGYDYGLFLNTLAALKNPLMHELYERTLSILDSTGLWNEYYDSDIPSGTFCRPWESGINLEALINYALSIQA